MSTSELAQAFRERYSFVAVDRNVLEKEASLLTDFPEDRALDLLFDKVASQGLAEEMDL